MARRRLTVLVPEVNCNLMVTHYSCHDEGALAAVGKGCKQSTWTIAVGAYEDAQELTIHLNVDSSILSQPKVRLTCVDREGEKVLFPLEAGKQKAQLRGDYQYTWPFRGAVADMGKRYVYEVKAPGSETWYPCILTRDLGNGQFEVTMLQPKDQSSFMALGDAWREVELPAVGQVINGAYQDIRHRASQQPLERSETQVTVVVPSWKPLEEACLVADAGQGDQLITHFFARSTPSSEDRRAKGLARVAVIVDRHRTSLAATLGDSRLREFLAATPRAIRTEHHRLHAEWRFRIGLAEHCVRLEKKYRLSKIVTVSVDGSVLVDAASKNLEYEDDGVSEAASSAKWQCTFRFVGEVRMDFHVFETNRDGAPVGTEPVAVPWRKAGGTMVECKVMLMDHGDCRTASLALNGSPFQELDMARDLHAEKSIEGLEPNVFESIYGREYGLRIPYQVNEDAAYGVRLLAENMMGGPHGGNAVKTVHAGPWGNPAGAPGRRQEPQGCDGWLDNAASLFACSKGWPGACDGAEQRVAGGPVPRGNLRVPQPRMTL